MEFTAILALITKGLTIASALIEVGGNALPTLDRLRKFVQKSFSGGVVQSDLDELETFLDSQIDEFNLDLPPA